MLKSIARPYAVAVSQTVTTPKKKASWDEALQMLDTLLQNKQISNLLHDPRVSKKERFAVLKAATQKQGFKEFWRLIEVLIQYGRLNLVSEIKDILGEIYNLQHEIVLAKVHVARLPAPATQKSIVSNIKKQHSCKEVKVDWVIDPKIIGGSVIEINSQQIDRSLLGRVNQFKNLLGVSV